MISSALTDRYVVHTYVPTYEDYLLFAWQIGNVNENFILIPSKIE